VGDAVLVAVARSGLGGIQKVTGESQKPWLRWITATGYYRESGLRYGLMSGRILGLATPEDYVERNVQAGRDRTGARERADRYKKVWRNLFARLPWHASITDDYNNRRGRFNLDSGLDRGAKSRR